MTTETTTPPATPTKSVKQLQRDVERLSERKKKEKAALAETTAKLNEAKEQLAQIRKTAKVSAAANSTSKAKKTKSAAQ